MSTLVKATLRELPASPDAQPTATPVDVQFNPSTLRVQISNRSAGGEQHGSQARQRPGTGEMTVSFDLVFDTADEGSTTAPVAVTRKTMVVEKFVRPRGRAPNEQTPPRVEFRWGSFLVQGVMESANIDLDHFAADGTALRAKVAVSIKGQNPEYRYDPVTSAAPAGAGNTGTARNGANAPPAGSPGTRGGAANPSKVAQAMPGESLQQLAARAGLDPAAWRALADGIANPLSLAAGTEVALPPALNLGPGLGQAGGNEPRQASAALPLVDRATLAGAAGAAPSAGARPDPIRQGLAVTRQGGLRGAIDQLRGEAQRGAVASSQSAFGLEAQAARTAGADTGAPRPYGAGVPLRPQRGEPGELLPTSADPTVPAWQALRARGANGARPLNRIRPVDSCRCDCRAPATRR